MIAQADAQRKILEEAAAAKLIKDAEQKANDEATRVLSAAAAAKMEADNAVAVVC